MEFLLSIAKPHLGVFTAIDAVHSEQFGDPNQIAHEEVKMIKSTLETAFLNSNDTYALQLKDHIHIDTFFYQTEGHESQADIRFEREKFVLGDLQGRVGVELDLFIKDKKYHVETNVIGKSNYGYIGVAIAILQILDYKIAEGKLQLPEHLVLDYELQPGRLSVFP